MILDSLLRLANRLDRSRRQADAAGAAEPEERREVEPPAFYSRTDTFPSHPWPEGLRLISVHGEQDEGEDGVRFTGPNAEGYVESVTRYPGQGWTYQAVFPASGVSIVLDEGDPLDDPNHYRPARATGSVS